MTTIGLTRKPAFWVAYAVLALSALAVAWQLFPAAIPLVNLDIRLGRDDAITQARRLAAKLDLAPANARAAARFARDQATQNYVELEGGGKEVFGKLVAGELYAPYWWEVRLFAPGEVTEATVRFRPDGAPYGFAKRLPELFVPAEPAGLALTPETARQLAEEKARTDWGIDFALFKPLEQTQQKRTTGRVDHAFVYERIAGNLADSRFRLRLAVAGDELTELAHYVHVPESFDRRFQELRSANSTIAGVASLTAGALYGLGGCIIGVLWLLRRHWLAWRPALVAGYVVGSLLGLMTLAAAPTAWFGFDTAQSVTTFWIRQAGAALAIVFAGGLAYALVFMAAESLSRRAFGEHPQLWRVWSREAAPTRQVLGRTLGGYLFVPIELALVAAFYYATNRWFGWWQPSEALTDPNILGSAVPALAPIAISLQAGFMEECLFRAVPLSLAALIGAHYGRRGMAIAIAVVVQALVFGGAHANYPGFPSYSRLVELFVPSVLWALIFLRFGLVPTILLHALFDLVLFAIPVFLVDAPGSGAQRALVIAAGLVPLAIIGVRRLRAGAWGELAAGLANGAWQPAASATHERPAQRVVTADTPRWTATFQRALPVLGIGGLIGWALATPFRSDVPPLPIARAAAEAAADAALRERAVELGPEWRRASVVRLASDEPGPWQGHKFVWREAGREAYAKLVGTTLAPPLWDVRYARFEGEVADRAEEWRITINGDGTVRQVRHALPEGRSGAKLARDAAQTLAERALRERFGLDAVALKLIGAEEKQRPDRIDWAFTFANPRVEVGKDGEARILITLAGDEIVGYGRFVHVPEAWQRVERERDGRVTILRMALAALLGVAGLAALIMAVIDWTRGRCDRRALAAIAAIVFALGGVAIANGWPQMAMNLNTAEPIASQMAIASAGGLLGALVRALAVGLAAGVGAWAAIRQRAHPISGPLPVWAAGVAAALFAAGVGAALERLAPQTVPLWPAFAVESLALPALGAISAGVRTLAIASVGLFVLCFLEWLTAGWQRRGALAALVLVTAVAASSFVAAQDPVVAAVDGVVTGLATAAIVYGLLRFDATAVPAYLATGAVLQLAENALLKGTPTAFVHAALAAAIAIGVAWALTRYLDRARTRVAAGMAA